MTAQVASTAVIGPGAIGGAVAGALIQNGHDPVLVGRTAFDSLRVTHPGGEIAAPTPCRTDPDECTAAEVVFLGVKAHQTEAARPWLDALVGPDTALCVLQNGVEHVERLQPLVADGAEVVPAVVALPSRRPAPGEIEVTGRARLIVPSGPGAARVAALLDDSFVTVRARDDWLTPAWEKLMMNAALGGCGVLTGQSSGGVVADPGVRRLVVGMMQEIVLVARAEGASIADDRPDQIIDGVVAAAGSHLSSIVVDRIAGYPTEWDARNAVVERVAARHGIDVPLNAMVTALIRSGEPDR